MAASLLAALACERNKIQSINLALTGSSESSGRLPLIAAWREGPCVEMPDRGACKDALPEPPPVKQPLSMDQAAKQAEAQIASLDAVAAKAMKKRVVRKGVPSPPPLPE